NLKAADDTLLVDYYRAKREYLALFWPIVREQVAAYSGAHLAAALAAGAAWAVFLIAAGRLTSLKMIGAAMIALLLGAASTQVVVFLSAVTDDFIAYDTREKTIIFDFLYAILGIGVREEFIKILFFAPLALFIRRFPPLAIISIASMAGLGFAIEENISYFHSEGGTAVAARFLSANFLHLSLTGYAGYMLATALGAARTRAQEVWSDFSSSLVNVMFFHGLYDFFLIDQTLQGFWFFSTVVLVWTTREYLQVLTALRRTQDRIPLTAVFVGALGASAGTGFVLLAQEVGVLMGLLELLAGLLGLAIIAVVFFREIDERLA
ncbi:MAG: PrsW family intramembrane metalloprotease, partial [Spirochaetia bacterium]|nr:PrsW family intramembrane metalloprotease [Spirochaetia bacterium]